MVLAQVSIGDPVIVHPGVYIVHGQVVADGLVEIGPGAVISPFVTIGLRAGRRRGADDRGERQHRDRREGDRPGAGRRRRARSAPDAVVVDDVAAGVTVVGVPARPAGVDAPGL